MTEHRLYQGPTGSEGVVTTEWLELGGGAVSVCSRDIGEALEPFFGRDEHEWRVTVAAADVQQLMTALVTERFGGRCGAISEFRTWCQERGIPVTETVDP